MIRLLLLSACSAGPAGAEQEEHLLQQRNANAVGLHSSALNYIRAVVHVMWSQNGHRLDVSHLAGFDLLALGRVGKEGQALPVLSSALAADQVEVWLEGHAAATGLAWLSRVLLKISRMPRLVGGVLCPSSDHSRKKTGMERSGTTLPFLRAGWLGGSGIGRTLHSRAQPPPPRLLPSPVGQAFPAAHCEHHQDSRGCSTGLMSRAARPPFAAAPTALST